MSGLPYKLQKYGFAEVIADSLYKKL